MIEPLEKTDPYLAAQFMAIARGELNAAVYGTRVFETKPYFLKYVKRPPLLPRIIREIKLDLGRNDPCLCGSGKKFKKCCQKEEV